MSIVDQNEVQMELLEQVAVLLKQQGIKSQLYKNYFGDTKYDEIIFYKDGRIASIGLDPFEMSTIMFLAVIGDPASGRGKLPKGDIYYHYNYESMKLNTSMSAEEVVAAIQEYYDNLDDYYDPTPTGNIFDDEDDDIAQSSIINDYDDDYKNIEDVDDDFVFDLALFESVDDDDDD